MNTPYTIDTPINQFRQDITADMLLAAIKSMRPDSPLATSATCQAYIDAGRTNSVDQVYLCAHSILESAWGTSYYAINRHNLYGYQAYDSNPDNAGYFASNEACIQFIARFVSVQYLSPSGQWYGGSPSLKGMNVHYATAGHWATSIAQIMNQLQAHMDFSSTGTAASPPTVTSFNRNAQIVASVGVKVRFFPTTQSAVSSILPVNTTIAIDGYCMGETISGNAYWLKLKGQNLFVWAGATNVSEIPGQVAAAQVAPAVAPLDPSVNLQEKFDEVKATLSVALAASKMKDTTISDLQKQLDDAKTELDKVSQAATNLDAAANMNKYYEGQIEAYKTKVGELNTQLKNAVATAFTGWELTELPSGSSAVVKYPTLALKVLSLIFGAKNSSYVVGWKKGAHLYQASDPALQLGALQAVTK